MSSSIAQTLKSRLAPYALAAALLANTAASNIFAQTPTKTNPATPTLVPSAANLVTAIHQANSNLVDSVAIVSAKQDQILMLPVRPAGTGNTKVKIIVPEGYKFIERIIFNDLFEADVPNSPELLVFRAKHDDGTNYYSMILAPQYIEPIIPPEALDASAIGRPAEKSKYTDKDGVEYLALQYPGDRLIIGIPIPQTANEINLEKTFAHIKALALEAAKKPYNLIASTNISYIGSVEAPGKEFPRIYQYHYFLDNKGVGGVIMVPRGTASLLNGELLLKPLKDYELSGESIKVQLPQRVRSKPVINMQHNRP